MITVLLALGLVIVSFVVSLVLRNQMLGQIDEQLTTTAEAFGNRAIRNNPGNGDLPTTYYVEAKNENGQNDGPWINPRTAARYGTPRLGDALDLETALEHEGRPQLVTVESEQPASQWRVIIMLMQDDRTQEYIGVVAIALPLKDVTSTLERTNLVVLFSDIIIILLGALTATYLVRRSFRSLRQIEGVAGRIAQGDLSARILVTEPPTTEVGSLQRALNTMLSQNEHAFSVQVVAQERMTRFISDASHELRTPLAAIRGYGELYRMGGVSPEKTSEVMGRIEDESNRMGRLVDDLLQLARMDEGRQMDMTEVDLTDLAGAALSDMAVLAPDRDCALVPLDPEAEAAGQDAPSVTVVGDKDRLSQVLTNLLGNVVRHTPDGTPVEIAVGTSTASRVSTDTAEYQVAVVEVRDHGAGVPPDEADKVFQRFYRSDSSRNRETGGSGLGLSIVLGIVERHRGTVQMLQTPGGGATVHIELPLPDDTTGHPSPPGRRTGRPGHPAHQEAGT